MITLGRLSIIAAAASAALLAFVISSGPRYELAPERATAALDDREKEELARHLMLLEELELLENLEMLELRPLAELPEEERAPLREAAERLRSLSKEEQTSVRSKVVRWRQLTPEQRYELRRRWREQRE